MAWTDRLKEAAYTAPDGTRLTFEYVDVSKTIRKKTPAHDFPSADGTYVDDKGLKGDLFPLRVFFSGENHDLAANGFENLIRQQGRGTLEHPLYGSRTVVPFGDITRNEALVTDANQTVFEIVFWETLAAIYPGATVDTVELIDEAVESYDEGGAQQFAASVEVAEPGAQASFGATMRQLKDGAASALTRAQGGVAKVRSKMSKIDKAIDSTIETFIGGPLVLAFQMRQLINAPARKLDVIRAKLDGFGNLLATTTGTPTTTAEALGLSKRTPNAEQGSTLRTRLDSFGSLTTSIISGAGTGAGGGTGSSATGVGIVDPGTGAPGAIADANNAFHANKLVAEILVLSVALAVSGETYRTRREALDAAKELADLHDAVIAWSESNYEVLFAASVGPDSTRPAATGVGSLDTGESRQVMTTVVSRTISYLIETSFTLGIERTVVIGTPRTAIDFVAEYYGSLAQVDEFIDANELTGDEILELPIGRLVRYYAE